MQNILIICLVNSSKQLFGQSRDAQFLIAPLRWGGSPKKKEKKKVTNYFLSLSAGFAANMPGISAKERDSPQFNRDRPEKAGLSPLNRTYSHPTF